MKKILTILLLLLGGNSALLGQWNQHYIIHVVNAATFKEPSVDLKNADNAATHDVDLARHKHHEVNVYRSMGPMGLGYKVNYYQDESSTIVPHSFFIGSADKFDQVDYTWSKDTLVVQLFNADKKDKVYKGYGWGSKSGMVVPD